MKAKKKGILFVCQNCGYQSGSWLGRCPDCRQWETLVEERPAPAMAGRRSGVPACTPIPLHTASDTDSERWSSGLDEFDRVLGGGIVPGSLVLVGGDPGIGKSTLILQMLGHVAGAQGPVLYVTGEESARQVKMRAGRLGVHQPELFVATENGVEAIVEATLAMRPRLLAVDSIQTLVSEEFPSAPGSVTQIRETAARLLTLAKTENIPVVLVGHVTKEGAIAGPKVLEHMVDTVLYFEGDRGNAYRILRTVKNRFGSTNEIGVFEMKEEGLREVVNPSEMFLAERPLGVPGSVVLPSMEGTRPILVEVQALVSPSSLGTPRRTAIGADPQRLALLTAVLDKKAGMALHQHDIFLNIAGGIRILEPALDLGVVCALASSLLERPIGATTAVCGEVGLAGEVRAVGQIDSRLQEAARLGFSRLILPKSNTGHLGAKKKPALEVVGITSISELLELLFNQ